MRKAPLLPALLAAMGLWLGGVAVVVAQLPGGFEVKANPQIPLYRQTPRGQIVDGLITFQSASSAGSQTLQVRDFDMRTFRAGDTNQVQIRALAPTCRLSLATKIASDPGPIEIFTPTTNLDIRGRGFYCNQNERLLIISNNVETSIAKALLKAPLLGGGSSNAEQHVLIYADYCHFDSLSNVVDYVGHVRVFDPQGDSSSQSLRVYLTTNNAVRSLLWRDDVVINVTNRGQATGQRAFYVVTNGGEQVQLTGEAAWRNGPEEARAQDFLYDSAARILRATNHVRVSWPNPPGATNAHPTLAKLFSDTALLRWPPTNGPIEEMTADGNVLLVNQGDQSWATGEHAVYSRPQDTFQLTGNPFWRVEQTNNQMEVKGQVLTVELTNRVYHADGGAQFVTRDSASTNRTLQIDCRHLDYQTNLAEFHDHVVAWLFEGGVPQDTLSCRFLTAALVSNRVQSAVAQGGVRGETAPDAAGARKTLRCEILTARRNPATGLLERIVGQTGVVLEEFTSAEGKATNAKPMLDTLRAEEVTAIFSPVTNKLQSAIAERHVELEQRKNGQILHATAERAVYAISGTNVQVTLTGEPAARTDKYTVADANSLLWFPQGNGFRAVGPYHIIPATVAK